MVLACPWGVDALDVKRILDTIREVEEWAERKESLEVRIKALPRSQRATLRSELEIVRQQLEHYQALVQDMKRTVAQPTFQDLAQQL
jgi:hypothetical protein